jgi:RNA polymerase-binding transcription factor
MERAARKTGAHRGRDEDLRDLLEDRRREILEQVQHGIRHVRAHHGRGSLNEVRDSVESSDAILQEDLDLALLQLKTETLEQIEDALARLDERSYGFCFECGGEISRQRLVSLPFAVRCTRCEEAREAAERAEKPATRREAPSPESP